MAYIITFTTTKPTGTLWYADSGIPGAATVLANIDAWTASQAGFISESMTHITDDVSENQVIFDSAINGDAWLLAKQTQADYVIRNSYLAGLPTQTTVVITTA